MPNLVTVGKDGVVFCSYDGSQTADSLGLMVQETEKITSKLQNENKPVLILVDLTRFGNASLDARAAAETALKRRTFDKVALFGANRFLRHISNLIIFASGQNKRVRHFGSEHEARAWLLEKNKT